MAYEGKFSSIKGRYKRHSRLYLQNGSIYDIVGYEQVICHSQQREKERVSMEIQIDQHTLELAEERGTNEKEIINVVDSGFSIPGKYGRVGKAKIYDFKQKRHNKYYEQKRVEVFYTIEENVIITVTVYVFYGKWEEG